MFEQMGAAVSYDPSSKVATISKPGAEIVVTVGKPEVIVNGETASARRAADRLQRRRYGADSRDLRRHGRLRFVGAGPPHRRRALRSADAASNGSAAAARARGDHGAGAGEDQKPVDARRIFPLVLLHAPERIEQSGNAVQLLARRKVQLQRGQPGDVGTARSPCTAIGTSPTVAGTSAARISMPIRLTVRASVRPNHAKNAPCPSPNCVQQVPPNTNPDDTLPGFTMSTVYEAYLAYKESRIRRCAG